MKAFDAVWLGERLARLLPEFPDVSLCIALSGGLDSTVLLAALAAGRDPATRLRAIHVNHGLHPNARLWSAHCKALAGSFDVPLKIIRVKVPRLRGASPEAQAREARYEAFARELATNEVLLTGQHEDDQLETVLLQLFRGAGLPGLAAMPERARFARGWLARPLLPVARAALESWARARGLLWVEDDSNADERFDRNYLRRRVLPAVRQRWPGVAQAVSRSARHAAEAQRLLNAAALADVERAMVGEALSVQVLRLLSEDRRRNALRLWIAQRGAQAPNTRRLEEIAGPLLAARPEARPKVEWPGATVQRRDDLLWLVR